jgi:hypothetical protein
MSAIASPSRAPSAITIVSRVVAALAGGWLFVWGCTTLGISLGLLAGVSYRESVELAYLLAFPLFLIVFCWAFAAASGVRVWLVLAGGGGLMSLAAWALARTL